MLNVLSRDRYTVTQIRSSSEFRQFIEQEKNQIDCLLLQGNTALASTANWLHGQAVLLPAVVLVEERLTQEALVNDGLVKDDPDQDEPANQGPAKEDAVKTENWVSRSSLSTNSGFTYHTAEISITLSQLDQLDQTIDQAIAQFINLSPICRTNNEIAPEEVNPDLSTQNFLLVQQRRLAEKLKERLGYLGVYYKRNPQNFFRHLPPDQKQELLDNLKSEYRNIILCYFVNDGTLNQQIDDFVNTVFFTDIAVAQIVEIHMDLMDEFSNQLKLEGRSEEILLDYRLTLIDTIAHLCEMYRRSIPREA